MKNIDLNVFCGFYRQPLERLPRAVIAYHVTSAKNLQSILEHGLQAQACVATSDGESRQPAVYMFAAKNDAYDKQLRAVLFGDDSELVVLRITIPQTHFQYLREDGIFNVIPTDDGGYPTAMQFTADVPAEWITLA